MSNLHQIKPLVDLCRAYDALHAGTPIAHAIVRPAIDAVTVEIVKLCALIAGDSSSDVPAHPKPVTETAATVAAAEDATKAQPAKQQEPMPFAEFSRALATFVGTHHHTVKKVLSDRGLSAAMDAAAEERRAIVEEVTAAVAQEVGNG